MPKQTLLDRIVIDPAVCFGRPCVKGHRIWVALVLDRLASGEAIDELVVDYPGVEREDLLACIAYGAEMSRSRTVEGERDVA